MNKRQPRSLPATSGQNNRRRAATLAVFALAIAVFLALWFAKKPAAAKASTATPAAETNASAPEVSRTPSPPTSLVSASEPRQEEPAPVIDDIVLEKTEVCAGEENLVTIKAHTVNNTDSELHYSTDGLLGSSVPITLFPSESLRVFSVIGLSSLSRRNPWRSFLNTFL